MDDKTGPIVAKGKGASFTDAFLTKLIIAIALAAVIAYSSADWWLIWLSTVVMLSVPTFNLRSASNYLLACFVPVMGAYGVAVMDGLNSAKGSILSLFGANKAIWNDTLSSLITDQVFWDALVRGLLAFFALPIFVLVVLFIYHSQKSRDPKEVLGYVIESIKDPSTIDFEEASVEETYNNPAEELDSSNSQPPEESVEASVIRIVEAAKLCYDQYELTPNDDIMIHFVNDRDYVDSYLNVKTDSFSQVSWLNAAFTIPPNIENPKWAGYNLEIDNPETAPKLLLCEEIARDGSTEALSIDYLSWLADSLEVVLAKDQTVDGERPPQQAPKTMY